MKTSETTGEISAALAKAQGEYKHPARKHSAQVKGGKIHKYADLTDTIDAVKAALSKNGIALVQAPGFDENGRYVIETRLMHSSGEWIAGAMEMPEGLSAHALGSALTYNRRYSITAILGIAADDDDDGGAAEGEQSTKKGGGPPRGGHPPKIETRNLKNRLDNARENAPEGSQAAPSDSLVQVASAVWKTSADVVSMANGQDIEGDVDEKAAKKWLMSQAVEVANKLGIDQEAASKADIKTWTEEVNTLVCSLADEFQKELDKG